MISLDPTTRAEHDAQVTTGARALAVRNALVDPVTVKVINGSGATVGTGTMATPWASVNNNVLTIGSVTGFTTSATATPDPLTWRLRFESGSRWIEGSFGLTSDATADFKWSKATYESGQVAQFQNASAYTFKTTSEKDVADFFNVLQGSTLVLAWKPEVVDGVPYTLPQSNTGVEWTYDLKNLCTIPQGSAYTFTAQGPLPVGFVVQPDGVIVKGTNATAAIHSISVTLAEVAQAGIVDPYIVVTQNTVAQPSPLGSYTDPRFGTTITRLSAKPGNVTSGTAMWRHVYSQVPAWNTSGQFLQLLENGFTTIVDAVAPYTVRIVNPRPNNSSVQTAFRWSSKFANRLYYLGTSHNTAGVVWPVGWTQHSGWVLVACDINPTTYAATYTVVGSFPGRTIASGASWEKVVTDASNNEWVAILDSGANQAFAYNITAGASAGSPPSLPVFTPSGNTDAVKMTPKGDGVIQGTDYHGFTSNYGTNLYSLTGAYVKQLCPAIGHGDAMVDANGVQWWCYLENGNSAQDGQPGYYKARIDGATVRDITKLLGKAYDNWGCHISAVGTDFFCVSADTTVATENYGVARAGEIFLLYLDSTVQNPHMLRLCQHRSRCFSDYWAQPHAVIKHDGTQVLFASNWGTVGGQRDVYTVNLP